MLQPCHSLRNMQRNVQAERVLLAATEKFLHRKICVHKTVQNGSCSITKTVSSIKSKYCVIAHESNCNRSFVQAHTRTIVVCDVLHCGPCV